MLTFRPLSAMTAITLAFASACGTYSSDDLDVGDTQAGCSSDDPRVGTDAELDGRAHGVRGRVAIIDDCTVELRDFHFDGGGLDVRAIGASTRNYENGAVLTNDLRRASGYNGETLRIAFPTGVGLDDVQHLSIWCVPANVSFGDASLADELNELNDPDA